MAGGTYTFLFTDLVGSTAILDELGDAANEPLRRSHARLLRSEVEAHRGRLVKSTGDGVMAAFASPSDAVACAISVQQAVDLHNRTSGLRPLAVRVGLQLGEVEEEDNDYFGTAVVVANRLCDAAGAGQILASDVVRAVVAPRGEHGFQPVGELALKGFAEPLTAFDVQWEPLAGSSAGDSDLHDEFVGRNVELDALDRAWHAARSGERALVLISGEPGIGKTRLAMQQAERASTEGALVLVGRCDEQAPIPYLPFTEALGPQIDSALLGATPAALAMPGGEELERSRLYDAVTRAVANLAQASPVVLVLDDLHWADEASLLLLRHVLRRTEGLPLLVIGTYRDTDLSRSHPLASTLGELARLGAHRIDLRGLDESEVAMMLGQDAPPGQVAEVHAETEGNPFFVQEVARHLAESGAVGGPVPQGVRDVIGRRLSRLDDTTVRLLQVASVIGRDFDLLVLASISDVSEDDAIACLEHASGSRLVEEVRGVLDRYRFAHALVRDTLLEELGTSRRVRLHDRIVSAIESIYSADLEPHLMALAHHANEAAATGHTVRAARYALQAAEYALQRLGFEDVVRLSTQGLQALDLGGDDLDLRARLLLMRSDGHRGFSRADSVADARAALDAARRLGEPVLVARAAINSFDIAPGEYSADLEAQLQEGLSGLPANEVDHRAALHGMLAAATLFGPAPAQSVEHGRQARELADRATDPALASTAIFWGAGPTALSGDTTFADRILALAEQAGHPHIEVQGRCVRVTAAFARGDFEAVREEVERLRQVTAEVPWPFGQYAVELVQATLATAEGRFRDASRHSRAAGAAGATGIGDAFGQMAALTPGIAAFLRLRAQGRSAEMVEPIKLALASSATDVGWRPALAALLADMGRLDEAREEMHAVLRRGLALVPRVVQNWSDPLPESREAVGLFRYGAALLIEAAVVLEDEESLAVLYDELVRQADLDVVLGWGPVPPQWLGSSHLYLGMASAVLGRWEDAERHLRTAIERHDRVGARPFAADARHHLAVALSRRRSDGDAAEAEQLWDAAQREVDELGLVRLGNLIAAART